MSKHRGGGQPVFSRLSSRIKNFAKGWYKKHIHRGNRKRLRQSDPQEHRDKQLDPRSLD